MALKICILETDDLRPDLMDTYQGYGHMFQQLFAKQAVAAEFVVYNVLHGHYPDDDEVFDAYLITGSKADSFAQEPWILRLKAYLLDRFRRGDKLLGICFGHQLLALTLGGEAARAKQGWCVGLHQYRLEQQEAWMQPPLQQLSLLASHRDQVTALPDDAVVLASSDFCAYAAYRIGDQVLCFQGHPEFVADYSRALLNGRRELYGEKLYETAMKSLEMPHQGVVIAEWMLRFVAADSAA